MPSQTIYNARRAIHYGEMHPTSSTRQIHATRLTEAAPWLITAGLGMVTLAQFTPFSPVLIGVGLLMLGSTLVVTSRFESPRAFWLIAVNLITYMGLYALFLGALIYPGPLGVEPSPPWVRLADLGVSAGLLVLSLRLGLQRLQEHA